MENMRIADLATLLLVMLALIAVIAVATLLFTFIFAWVVDVIEGGYQVIHSVALVFSSLIIAAALIVRK